MNMASRQATGTTSAQKLADTIDEALELLDELPSVAEDNADTAIKKAPESLLEECMQLCEQYESVTPEPIRTIHHFACTGGTLISNCLAAMPNTQVLSEVDPLSTQGAGSQDALHSAPTDMIQQMRKSTRGANDELVINLFLNNMEQIHADASKKGQRVIVRDHAHNYFCANTLTAERPDLRELLTRRFAVEPMLIIRHPLDSYLALRADGWLPCQTLDEYARCYTSFLDAYASAPVVKYEDFVSDPNGTMAAVCDHLQLPYNDAFEDLHSVFHTTANTNVRDEAIRQRPPRPLPPEVAAEQNTAEDYKALLDRLGYPQRPHTNSAIS